MQTLLLIKGSGYACFKKGIVIITSYRVIEFPLCAGHHSGGTKALLSLTSGAVSLLNHGPVCHCKTLN